MAEAAEVRGKGRFVSHNIISIIKCEFGSNADSIYSLCVSRYIINPEIMEEGDSSDGSQQFDES